MFRPTRSLLFALAIVLALPLSSTLAATISTTAGTSLLDDEMGTAALFTGSPATLGNFGDDSSSPSYQTFQLSEGFTLSRFAFAYEYDGSSAPVEDITFSIYQVADTLAAAPIALGPVVWTLENVSIANEGASDESALIVLDPAEQVFLPATTGSAGYAFGISGTDDFEWIRSNSTAGSTYDFGHAYQGTSTADGNSIDRDWYLSLGSRVPEPGTASIALVLGLIHGLVGRRR